MTNFFIGLALGVILGAVSVPLAVILVGGV